MSEYQTVNTTKNPETKNWCLVLKAAKPIKQAGVKIGNRTYQYASYYDINKGDVAIVGFRKQPKTQGEMGVVESTLDKLAIRRDLAADLAFVFTDHADKRMITACKKYILEDTENADADDTDYYPVTYMARRMIAACCIVAFPQLSSPEDIQLAKEYIRGEHYMFDIPTASYNTFDFYDYYGKNSPSLGGWLHPDDYYDKMDEQQQNKIDDKFNKRVFCDTVAIMLRGGFVNILEAFLSVDPPIGKYYKDIIKAVGDAYDPTAMDVLKAYDPSKGWQACKSVIGKIAGEREENTVKESKPKTTSVASGKKSKPDKSVQKELSILEYIKPKMIPDSHAKIQPAYVEYYRKKQEEADRIRAEYIGFVDTTNKISFAGKTFAFDASINTDKLSDVLSKAGGSIGGTVNGSIDYFVVYTEGKELYTVKAGWQKVVDLQKKGKSIKIIDLRDFLKALS